MAERYLRGVQIEPVGLSAVQFVALNGDVEAFCMGAVNAQLVRAARVRP